VRRRRPLFRQVVFSAEWQESCWRQFVRKGEKLTAGLAPWIKFRSISTGKEMGVKSCYGS
jgi:hypothetical protein